MIHLLSALAITAALATSAVAQTSAFSQGLEDGYNAVPSFNTENGANNGWNYNYSYVSGLQAGISMREDYDRATSGWLEDPALSTPPQP